MRQIVSRGPLPPLSVCKTPGSGRGCVIVERGWVRDHQEWERGAIDIFCLCLAEVRGDYGVSVTLPGRHCFPPDQRAPPPKINHREPPPRPSFFLTKPSIPHFPPATSTRSLSISHRVHKYRTGKVCGVVNAPDSQCLPGCTPCCIPLDSAP